MTVTSVDAALRPEAAGAVLEPRYEVLPFGTSEEQASQVGERLRLTVTTSPKHGVDRSLERACRLRALGHDVTLHVAARMVRDESHLDELLERGRAAAIDDLFVIGGDAPEPHGPFASAGELLDLIAGHALRPPRIGIAAYPEGHPLITPQALDAALEHKARMADYLVTQLCFDARTLISWLDGVRARGIAQPVYIGAVGPVERRRLLEISTRIGVGPSLRFLRKQRGLLTLLRSPLDTAVTFYDAVVPFIGQAHRGISGFHFFTFNDLLGTRRWHEDRLAAALSPRRG